MLAVLGFRGLDTEGDAEHPACLSTEAIKKSLVKSFKTKVMKQLKSLDQFKDKSSESSLQINKDIKPASSDH